MLAAPACPVSPTAYRQIRYSLSPVIIIVSGARYWPPLRVDPDWPTARTAFVAPLYHAIVEL